MSPTLRTDAVAAPDSLAADVRRFLTSTPRQLPSRALYDTLGSALFDAICHLPWYPITRAERRLIAGRRQEILAAAGMCERLIELGCGNGEKLDLLLGSDRERTDGIPQRIDLVDVSASALAAASRLISEDRNVVVGTHQQRYEEGIRAATRLRAPGERIGVLFLGSNIGNFDPPGARAFLTTVRETLRAGDSLVIGADLIKPERELLLAYDDPLGVTAAFNKNLLVRLNREMGATFDVTAFDHRAIWNAEQSRVEMHLVSRARQRVDVPAAGLSLDLAKGDAIWTESSYKYEIATFETMLRRAGFEPARHWVEREGQFVLVVARVAEKGVGSNSN
jgi:dimethylhistidine N-methyltransferase